MTKKERQSVNIAIDASRAFLHERTGIEEYSYQVIRHLRAEIGSERVTLFLRRGTAENIDFDLPECWRVKELWAPRLWTYAIVVGATVASPDTPIRTRTHRAAYSPKKYNRSNSWLGV